MTNLAYGSWAEGAQTIDGIGTWRGGGPATLTEAGEPRRIRYAAVTPSLLPLLAGRVVAGRLFEEGKAEGTLLVSEELCEEQLGRAAYAPDPRCLAGPAGRAAPDEGPDSLAIGAVTQGQLERPMGWLLATADAGRFSVLARRPLQARRARLAPLAGRAHRSQGQVHGVGSGDAPLPDDDQTISLPGSIPGGSSARISLSELLTTLDTSPPGPRPPGRGGERGRGAGGGG